MAGNADFHKRVGDLTEVIARYKTMTLDPPEFIRRFLMHVLLKGFHRIRQHTRGNILIVMNNPGTT
jgi:hypothetical protein